MKLCVPSFYIIYMSVIWGGDWPNLFSDLAFCFKRGHIWAFFQSEETVPLSNKIWNIMKTWLCSFKTIGLRESRPAAFGTFGFERS